MAELKDPTEYRCLSISLSNIVPTVAVVDAGVDTMVTECVEDG